MAYECMGRTNSQLLWPWDKLSEILWPFQEYMEKNTVTIILALVLCCIALSTGKEPIHNLRGKN